MYKLRHDFKIGGGIRSSNSLFIFSCEQRAVSYEPSLDLLKAHSYLGNEIKLVNNR